MKKILGPTDFSAYSRAGIKYAMHWAIQQDIELVFLHVMRIMKPVAMDDNEYKKYAASMSARFRDKLKKFITGLYAKSEIPAGKHSFRVLDGFDAQVSILDYCRKHRDINYICLSTRGAGTIKKIFGTTTGNLIIKSTVPVMAIPKNYRGNSFNRILYATDMSDYAGEIEKVKDFAVPLSAKVEMLHFTWPEEILIDKQKIEEELSKEFTSGFKVIFKPHDLAASFIKNLQKQIRSRRPSVVVMFTNQDRTLWQKLFMPSKAENLSFSINVPLLVFSK
jgi:nucleotide-binding universal stress UspA family protein